MSAINSHTAESGTISNHNPELDTISNHCRVGHHPKPFSQSWALSVTITAESCTISTYTAESGTISSRTAQFGLPVTITAESSTISNQHRRDGHYQYPSPQRRALGTSSNHQRRVTTAKERRLVPRNRTLQNTNCKREKNRLKLK
jgi:hypothetical protein